MTEFYSIDSEYAVHGDEDAIYSFVGMPSSNRALRDVVEPVSAFYLERELLREAETTSGVRNAGELD